MSARYRSEMFRNAHVNILDGNITQVNRDQINYTSYVSPEARKQKGTPFRSPLIRDIE